jgi:hypothetical protein
MISAGCSKGVTGDEKTAEDYVKSQGYEIASRRGEIDKYTLEKSRLYGGTETRPYQQAWGVQKVEPDKYFSKEIIVYGFTVKNHPLEKVYKQSNGTNIYIMLSEGNVIGGYSFPNADGAEAIAGALYSLDGKTLEELTGLSFEQWQKNWKEKYGTNDTASATNTLSKYETAQHFVEDRGYKIFVNSGANYDLQLPPTFNETINGVQIGALLKARNEQSKQNGMDFSSYLGKQVMLITYGVEDKNNVFANIDLVMDGNIIVGFWIDNHGEPPDFNVIVNAFEANNNHLLSFIKGYDQENRVLTFDEIEWVLQTDTKRVTELGLDAELDFPNGYYIQNESAQVNSLKVSDDVNVYIVNWSDLANPSLTDINGLIKRMAEYPTPYHLKVKDDVIVKILEQYRP